MHHDEKHINYNKLFDYINFMFTPSAELLNRMKVSKMDYENKMQQMDGSMVSLSKSTNM